MILKYQQGGPDPKVVIHAHLLSLAIIVAFFNVVLDLNEKVLVIFLKQLNM